jgi:hypothetical protein
VWVVTSAPGTGRLKASNPDTRKFCGSSELATITQADSV